MPGRRMADSDSDDDFDFGAPGDQFGKKPKAKAFDKSVRTDEHVVDDFDSTKLSKKKKHFHTASAAQVAKSWENYPSSSTSHLPVLPRAPAAWTRDPETQVPGSRVSGARAQRIRDRCPGRRAAWTARGGCAVHQ